jgi:hypothetical protein
MHMTLHRWLAAAALALAHTSVVHAADPEQPAGSDATESRALIAAGADLAVASDYVWRGFLENQTISVQPNLWMTVGDFTLSSWMNASRVGPNGRSLTERDLTLDYTHAFGSWTLSGGWINYTFVDVSVDRYSNEFYGCSRTPATFLRRYMCSRTCNKAAAAMSASVCRTSTRSGAPVLPSHRRCRWDTTIGNGLTPRR